MKSTTTLAFTGDIGFDHYMQNKWEDEDLIDPALLDILIDFIRAHGEYNYILMYKSGARIYNEVSGLPCCRYREDLREAVKLARKITPAGKACILSPAAASYGYFKNFEERGDVFQELIKG